MIDSESGVLTDPISGNHIVKVCRDQVVKVNSVAQYITKGLSGGEAVAIIARPSLRKALMDFLVTQGFDVQSFKDQGQIKFLDAEFLLSSLWIDDGIDAEAFEKFVSDPLGIMKLKYDKIRIFGEMVDLLWQKGAYDEAIQLENRWNDLFKKIEFSLFCTYSFSHIDPSAYDEALERICRCYTHHIPLEVSDLSISSEANELLDSFGFAWKRIIEKFNPLTSVPPPAPPV
ncbi:MEDS domain-containing protein [Nitrosomonas ureae]|uniref:MEDS: MEthanogen/methylotroph, DcmR Sensory domain n=1 Tax=Nitrosomonas ureae TaxID=44577 RepID=A0A1H5TGM5_9PROT|nr:MEDS domain-containing protein [Nitrosomonas ureae]SEF61348.1 MEDS: MEthanogen/methylotroph, DcmR Sensory domain [Nitrosomonas ureae]